MHKTIQKILVLWLILMPILASAGDQLPLELNNFGAALKSCQTLQTTGFNPYFFDNYEQQEYINGFLVIHLKLKTPFNDGRRWLSGFYLYKPDCSSFFYSITFTGLTPRPTMQFYSIRFTSATHFEFWDDEQTVQIMCGAAPCVGDLPPAMPDGSSYASISYQGIIDGGASGIVSDSLQVNAPPPAKEPVLIVPGILGTELKDDSGLIWPNLSGLVLDPDDGFMDSLRMDSDGKPLNSSVKPGAILSKIDYAFGTFDYADGLINQFISAGYSLNDNLYVFPYDWRLSIAENAFELGSAINAILSKTGALKLNVVAHSLGGLVFKQYLLNSQTPQVDNAIFVGVPNLGAAEAAHELIFGSNLDIPLLSAAEMQKLSQNMPSVYELLPSQEYFTKTAGFYVDLTAQNSPVLNYIQSKNLLISLGKNLELLNNAENLHNGLDNLDLSTKVNKIYDIVGCGQFTLKTINKMRQGSSNIVERILHGPNYRISGDSGDGTVLMSSAAHLVNAKIFYAHAKHDQMLSAPELRQAIVGLANGQESNALATDSGACGIQGKLISLNSSLNIQITDAITAQPINLNNLPRIGTGADTHIFLPTDSGQQYKVAIKPADSIQPIDLSITKIQPGVATIYNYNQINLTKEADAQISPDSNTVSNTDPQGNDQVVPPSQVLDQNDLGNQSDNAGQTDGAVSQSAASTATNATNLPQVPPQIVYLQPPVASANDSGGPADSTAEPGDQLKDLGNTQTDTPAQDSTVESSTPDSGTSGQRDINITFNFSPNGLKTEPDTESESQSMDQGPDDPNALLDQNQLDQSPQEQNVFVGGLNGFSYWNTFKKLFHLIFF